MSSVALPRPDRAELRSWLLLMPSVAVLGLALGIVAGRHPIGLPLLLAGSVGLLGALALAITNYDAAVAIGFLLLAVVKFEPAPTDGLFAIVIVVAAATGRFDIRRVPLAMTVTVSIFLALNLVSSIDAISTTRAVKFLGITLYLCMFALWLCTYVSSRRRARKVVVAYMFAAVASAVLSTLALELHFPGWEAFTGDGYLRAAGLFKDPNVYGPFLVPAALIALEESLHPRLLRTSAWTNRLLFLVLTVGVLFSYSRAAYLNEVVGVTVLLAVLALRRNGGRKALNLIVLLIVAGVATIGSISATGSTGFLKERAHLQTYDNDRFAAQRRGINFGETHPVGIGPGQFELRSPVASHSTYIRVLAEQGLLGLVLLIVLLAGTLGYAMRSAARGSDTYGIGSGALLAAWCGILANSFVVDTLHWRHLWVVAALIWIAAAQQRERQSRALGAGAGVVRRGR